MSQYKPTPKELREQADALLRNAPPMEDDADFDDINDEELSEEAELEELTEAEAAEAVITQMDSEIREQKDRSLRLMAEMENLRRRTEREVKDASRYAIAKFAGDMLSVSDNLSRALLAIPEEERAAVEGAFSALIEGVEMTERDLQSKLEKHGVRQINPEGEKFDPNLHQAMFEVPNPDVPNSTVVQVVQAGFVIGERVLRPAMVGIAKGGPKISVVADDTPPADPGTNFDEQA